MLTAAEQKRRKKQLLAVVDAVKATKGADGYPISDLFCEQPDRTQYADYYRVIKRPMALNDIRRKVRTVTTPFLYFVTSVICTQ